MYKRDENNENYNLSFSSVYRIVTKLGHMIPLWKGKNPIYIDGDIL
jgi:hypothetical protein